MMSREREQRDVKGSSMRDRARKRAEGREQQGNWVIDIPEGVNRFEPKVVKGGMKLNIIPYQVTISDHPVVSKGELWYQRTYFVHRDVGSEGKARICPLKTFKKPCPICEQRDDLVKKGADKDLIKTLIPKERELYNVIDLDDEDKGVQLWDISYHLFGKQLEKELREGKEDYAGFAELKNGYTLNVRFESKTLPTKDGSKANPFFDADRIDFEKRENYKDTILEDVHELDKMLIQLSYTQLEKEFLELDAEDIVSNEKETAHKESAKSTSLHREEGVEELKPVRTRERVRAGESSNKMKCPADGEFGKDCDALGDKCQDCPEDVWKACGELYEEMKKNKKYR